MLKLKLYFKHYFELAFVNKPRLLLTFVGIFVAVLLFTCSYIVFDSYYLYYFNDAQNLPDRTVLIHGEFSAEDFMKRLPEDSAFDKLSVFNGNTSISQQVAYLKIDNEVSNIFGRCYGIYANSDVVPIANDEHQSIPTNLELVSGRNIDDDDIAKKNRVVLISDFVNYLVYDGNGLGEVISLNLGVDDKNSPIFDDFEIIGTYATNYFEKKQISEFKKDTKNGNYNQLFTNIYIPYTVQGLYLVQDEGNGDGKTYETILIFEFEDKEAYETFLKTYEQLRLTDTLYNTRSMIVDKQEIIKDIEASASDTRVLLNALIIAFGFVSSLSIMSITFFAIKERIVEIGIRKAFGATRLDICFQFFMEMLVVSLISSIIAVVSSVILALFLQGRLQDFLDLDFTLYISWKHLLLGLLCGVGESVLCSFVPAIYAANVKVVDALRFE